MTFRTIRHRLTLVAAIAALATSAAVQATPASAAPPDSGLGANGAGDGPVGPSGCRGDCGSGGGLDCSRGDLDPDVRAAYCDNVPIVEVSPEQAKLAQFMKERCPGLNQAECSKFMRSRDWMKYATPDSCAAGDITGCALQTLPDRAKDLEAAVKATAGTVPEVKLEACPPGQTAACLDAIKAKLETPPATEAPAAPATEAAAPDAAVDCAKTPENADCDPDGHWCYDHPEDPNCAGVTGTWCDEHPDAAECNVDQAQGLAAADNGAADNAAPDQAADDGGAMDAGGMDAIDDGGGMADDGQ